MTTSGDTTSSDLDTVVAQETLVDPIPFATEVSAADMDLGYCIHCKHLWFRHQLVDAADKSKVT